ncbi:MAG: thioredoxin family protein [Steroidobacter sp.]
MRTLRLALAATLVSLLAIPASIPATLSVEGPMPSLPRATTWLNSPPLSTADLRGKVVLVDFWTYTCINWRRTLPYLRGWAEKYRDQGLVIVGVHTPEFSFEKDLGNVRRAAADQDVGYPIAVDNDYAIWNAFKNRYWPAVYLVDARGYVRHRQFGEGDYDKLETMIQQLLAEAGHDDVDRSRIAADARGAEVAADWKNLETPETYLGYSQAERFASPGGEVRDRREIYRPPARLELNAWALAGDWTMTREFAVANRAQGKVTFHFHARDVHLVMGPAMPGTKLRFRVTIGGQPPGAAHGVDVDADGQGVIDQPRMYQLIRQRPPIADRQLEIEFLDAGAQLFAFTFG